MFNFVMDDFGKVFQGKGGNISLRTCNKTEFLVEIDILN
jgi:hypothetical protein